MKSLITIFLTSISLALLTGCSSSVTEPEPQEFTLQAIASPAEGGTVTPQFQSIDEGGQATVMAEPTEGWEFDHWSGVIESEQNPIEITVNSDSDVTAHFNNLQSNYRVNITLEDGSGRLDALEFGQIPDPDSIENPEAPPTPPPGVLEAWFDRDGERIYRDFRDQLQIQADWSLHYRMGSGDNLTLSWEMDAQLMEGELILTGPEGQQINMTAVHSAEFNSSSEGEINIMYQLE